MKELHRRVYSGPVKRLIDILGIRNRLANVYAKCLWHLKMRQRTIEIRGASANFSASNISEFKRILYHSGEREILSDIIEEHDRRDVFLDVGANIGIFSCLIGDTLQTGEVIACEPHPQNFEKLVENIDNNDLPVTPYKWALYDEEGKFTFDMKSSEAGEGHGQVKAESGSEETVHTLPGDELLEREQIATPSTIKIDVEGAEMNVLRGLDQTLRSDDCSRVYCEVHPLHLPDYGYKAEDISNYLEDRGFKESVRYEFSGSWLIKFTKYNG